MRQESFRLLGESVNVRVGMRSLEGIDSGVEVLIRLSPPGTAFDTQVARDMLGRLEMLKDNGYQLTAQDGWWVVCEKEASEDEAASEGRFVLGLFADIVSRS